MGLAGCNLYPPVKVQNRIATAPSELSGRQGPNCASCHAYPLTDVHHAYHMMSIQVNTNQFGYDKLNGYMTCMDCHFKSIQHFSYGIYDTSWVDSAGNPVTERTRPSDRIAGIDSARLFRPIPYDFQNPSVVLDTTLGRVLAEVIDTLSVHQVATGKLVEWMTGSAHNNGRIDVDMAPNNVAIPESLATAFRPRDLSCSMVQCHVIAERYRWSNAKTGLGQCPSLVGENPDCMTPADPRAHKNLE